MLVAAPLLLDSCLRYYEKCILHSTIVSLNEMLARGALVILSPWSQDLSKRQLAISEQHWWCMGHAKKCISAGGLGPDHAKGSDTHKKTVTGDTVGDPLKGHFWTCFEHCDEAHCDPQPHVWVGHCCASNPKGGPFFE